MCNQNKDFSECAKLLVSACKEHQFNSKLAMTGKGIDRHLFVLYILSKGIEKSEFLDDYIERNWILSTTQVRINGNIAIYPNLSRLHI
jgi:carnitine O-palmitoyltransferase 1